MLEDRADIVMVMTDQHAARVIGCAGDDDAQTPALDRLAAQGTRYDSCYCPAPLCVPSRMAFLSGLEPHLSGVLNNDCYLPSDIPTIAHALGAAGYDCHLVGRMHFYGPDQQHGFAHRPIGDIGASWPGGAPPDIGDLTKGRGNRGPELAHSGAGETSYQAYDLAVADHAQRTLAMLKDQRRRTGKPFFLLVSLFCPHPPYIARRDDFDACADLPPPRIPAPETDHPALEAWRQAGGMRAVGDEATRTSRQAYYGLVKMIDRICGQVFDAVEGRDNTVSIYASDHGECLGERGLWWKSVMYDQSAKVPLILRGNGFSPGVDSRVCGLMDLSATILRLGQAMPLPGQVGVDLRGTSANAVTSSYYGGLMNIAVGDTRHRMLRHGPFKLMWFDGAPPMLFDLENDPDELTDLSGDPAHADTLARMTARLHDGWSPERIGVQQRIQGERVAMLRDWVRHTRPDEPARWQDPDKGRNRYE